jgi:hypothetical protein
MLIGALVAFAAAVLTAALIRQRDFVDAQPGEVEGPGSAARAREPRHPVAAH